MLTILGPAKTIDTTPHEVTTRYSIPDFSDHAAILIDILRKYSPSDLKKLMKINDKLATLNFERIASWKPDSSIGAANHALMAFSGEVFNGLKARSLSEGDLLFAQEHVRVLSGLYGVLRPLDLIMPYRLEMGTRLEKPRGKNLYNF